MGRIKHDAIIVTTWNMDRLTKAHAKAQDLGLSVSEIVRDRTNGYISFIIAPDGSKERWPASDAGDEARETWKTWVRQESLGLDWIHVRYGGDEEDARIEEHSGQDAS